MIEGMPDEDKSDYATARQKFIDMLGGIPLGRPKRPHEFAELVALLASDGANVSTGSEFVIDGDRLRRFEGEWKSLQIVSQPECQEGSEQVHRPVHHDHPRKTARPQIDDL